MFTQDEEALETWVHKQPPGSPLEAVTRSPHRSSASDTMIFVTLNIHAHMPWRVWEGGAALKHGQRQTIAPLTKSAHLQAIISYSAITNKTLHWASVPWLSILLTFTFFFLSISSDLSLFFLLLFFISSISRSSSCSFISPFLFLLFPFLHSFRLASQILLLHYSFHLLFLFFLSPALFYFFFIF